MAKFTENEKIEELPDPTVENFNFKIEDYLKIYLGTDDIQGINKLFKDDKKKYLLSVDEIKKMDENIDQVFKSHPKLDNIDYDFEKLNGKKKLILNFKGKKLIYK
jgi:oligoendopeptidase F